MTDWPKDYERLPFPTFGGDYKTEVRMRWEGVVADRARIRDPIFHGGKTEAIRMIASWEEKEHPLWGMPGRTYKTREAMPGPWIEFRNFKEANQFVQAYKRLGQ